MKTSPKRRRVGKSIKEVPVEVFSVILQWCTPFALLSLTSTCTDYRNLLFKEGYYSEKDHSWMMLVKYSDKRGFDVSDRLSKEWAKSRKQLAELVTISEKQDIVKLPTGFCAQVGMAIEQNEKKHIQPLISHCWGKHLKISGLFYANRQFVISFADVEPDLVVTHNMFNLVDSPNFKARYAGRPHGIGLTPLSDTGLESIFYNALNAKADFIGRYDGLFNPELIINLILNIHTAGVYGNTPIDIMKAMRTDILNFNITPPPTHTTPILPWRKLLGFLVEGKMSLSEMFKYAKENPNEIN